MSYVKNFPRTKKTSIVINATKIALAMVDVSPTNTIMAEISKQENHTVLQTKNRRKRKCIKN